MRILSLFVLAVFALTSCSKLSYFTQDLYQAQGWTEKDLKRIQFYLSEDVVLNRNKSSAETKIESGQFQVKNDKNIDQIVIKKRTPGVLVKIPKTNEFYVSFETEDAKYLIFQPNVKIGNKYVVTAMSWDNRKGTIKYGGQTYYMTSESALSALMVDIKKLNQVDKNKSTAKGRKI